MRTLAQQARTSTPTKLAILAAINITDQLFRLERQRQNGDAELDRRTQLLLETIEKYLETHSN
jgi:cell division protein ZapA (FtsZ GTPase activity inhibitor)